MVTWGIPRHPPFSERETAVGDAERNCWLGLITSCVLKSCHTCYEYMEKTHGYMYNHVITYYSI